jgi:hypothetical protein
MSSAEEIIRKRKAEKAGEKRVEEAKARQAAEKENVLLLRRIRVTLGLMQSFDFYAAELLTICHNTKGFLRDKTERFEKAAWSIGVEKYWSYGDELTRDLFIGVDGLVYRGSSDFINQPASSVEDENDETVRYACDKLEHLVNLLTLRCANHAVDTEIAIAFSCGKDAVTNSLNAVMEPYAAETQRHLKAIGKDWELSIETADAVWLKLRLDAGYRWLETGVAP